MPGVTTPDAPSLLSRSAHRHGRARPLNYYALRRDVDVSGVSGTGTVAYAIEFTTGVELVWDTKWVTCDWRPNMTVVREIHGYEGQTRIEKLDPESAETVHAEGLLARVLPVAIVTHAQAVGLLIAA